MANERITEGFVRDHFKDDVLFTSINGKSSVQASSEFKNCCMVSPKEREKEMGVQSLSFLFLLIVIMSL